MTIINFTPTTALLGGLFIGTSAALLLVIHGRIAGISGIIFGALFKNTNEKTNDRNLNLIFLMGMLLGAVLSRFFGLAPADISINSNIPLLISGGLLVGFGTIIGSGCTSGHGICGVSRLSKRSILATIIFIFSAMLTVAVRRYFL